MMSQRKIKLHTTKKFFSFFQRKTFQPPQTKRGSVKSGQEKKNNKNPARKKISEETVISNYHS